MVDKIVETVGDSAQCAAASSSEFKPSDLEAKIDRLAADIATLAAEVKRCSRSQSRDKANKNRKRSKIRSSHICWPHRSFGEQARVCKGTEKFPCPWSKPKALTDGKAGE